MAKTRKNDLSAKKAVPASRNPGPGRLVLLLLALFFLVIMAWVAMASGLFGAKAQSGQSTAIPAQHTCIDGQTEACAIGSCSGVSTCSGGSFGSCKWPLVCTPGSQANCLNNSCVYAYKVCNGCGSGYGSCIPMK